MKKIVSTLLAAMTLMLSLPLTTASTVHSADISPEIPIAHFVAEGENDTDLKALASSLGADTDYFNIKNYRAGENFPINNDSLQHFAQTADNLEAHSAKMNFSSAISSGSCMGISILEVLSHNGVISPSDIEEGAETLHDISLTTESDKYITSYQALQMHFELSFYDGYLISYLTPAQQADRLIEMAERNMAENRYFLINLHSDIDHAVVGIGITDGKWTYNDTEYDKCVLTLDSNAVDSEGNARGFSEKACIYINSETKQFYVPAYEADSAIQDGEKRLVIASIDDDTLLNYRGMINPPTETETDLSDENIFTLGFRNFTDYNVTITDADGTVHELEEPDLHLYSLTNYMYFTKGSEFHAELSSSTEMTNMKRFNIQNQRGHFFFEAYDAQNVTYDVSDERFRLQSDDNELLHYIMILYYNDAYNPCPPHYGWAIEGKIESAASFEINEKGLLVNSDSLNEMLIDIMDVKYDENGNRSAYEMTASFRLTAVDNVFITYDDENEIQLLIDPDGDGVYDTEVEKGDVDCSGAVDAVDASYVLTAYAKTSVGKSHYLYENIADYNSDGVVDANDASAILTYYTKQMVSEAE